MLKTLSIAALAAMLVTPAYAMECTKADMDKYVGLYAGTSLNTAQQKAIAGELEEMLNVMRDSLPDFMTIWGFEPTPAMLKLAGRQATTGIRRM